MAKYEDDKFIVINTEHLEIIDEAFNSSSSQICYSEHPHITCILNALKELRLEYEGITGKLIDQKYYVCNQDEPYAQKVIDIIIECETEKELQK